MTDSTIIDRVNIEQIVDRIDADLLEEFERGGFAIVCDSKTMLSFFIDLAQVDADLATNLADQMQVATGATPLIDTSYWYFPTFTLDPVEAGSLTRLTDGLDVDYDDDDPRADEASDGHGGIDG